MTSSPGTHPAPDLPPGPRAALVIATSTYADAALTRLEATARDAAAVAAVLGDPAIGGFKVTPVLDRGAWEVRLVVDEFLSGRGREDLVVVYLSCHGLLDARDRLYFAASDTRKDRLAATGVEAAWLLDQLEECRAARQVVILDCCFSGAFAGGKGGDGTDVRVGERLIAHGRGRTVLTASKASERSWEGQPDSGVAGPSVFTRALAEGLRTGAADTDGDGYISVDDAYRYAYEEVIATGAGQTPQHWTYGGEGAIWLARSPAGRAVIPVPLPEALRTALDSPLPEVRAGAVHALGTWLTDPDPARTLTAHQMLQHIAATDSPTVAAAARALVPAGPDPRSPSAALAAGPHHGRAPAAGTANPSAPAQAPAPARSPGSQPTSGPTRLARTLTSHQNRRQLAGHLWPVPVTFSPDGLLLATASSGDRTVQLWNPATGEHIRALTGEIYSARAVAFSPDGRLLATASGYKAAQLWNPATGEHIRTLQGHRESVWAVAFSPDGQLLATGSSDKKVRLWNPVTGKQIRALKGHTNMVGAVAFSPDRQLLATASSDHTARLWNPATGEHIRVLQGHGGSVWAVAFSPGGKLLATASSDHTARLWNPATGEHIRVLQGHGGSVWAVAFSPGGKLLATASSDHTARLWNPATGEHIRTLTGHTDDVKAVAFSPDGQLLATASSDNTARIWE